MSAPSRSRRALRSASKPCASSASRPGDTAIVIADRSQETPRRARGLDRQGPRGGRRQGGQAATARRTWPADPNLAIPVISAGAARQSGHQADRLSGRPDARQRAGLHAGRRQEARRDRQYRLRHSARRSSPAFEDGWVQLTADQQPFLQGYLPIVSLCQPGRLRPRRRSMSTPAPASSRPTTTRRSPTWPQGPALIASRAGEAANAASPSGDASLARGA